MKDRSRPGRHPGFLIAIGQKKYLIASGTTVDQEFLDGLEPGNEPVVVLHKGNAAGLNSPLTAFFKKRIRWVDRSDFEWCDSYGECPGFKFGKLTDAAHELKAKEPGPKAPAP